jgi:hypothetical protein
MKNWVYEKLRMRAQKEKKKDWMYGVILDENGGEYL